jgi:cysteine-rich repeat protein
MGSAVHCMSMIHPRTNGFLHICSISILLEVGCGDSSSEGTGTAGPGETSSSSLGTSSTEGTGTAEGTTNATETDAGTSETSSMETDTGTDTTEGPLGECGNGIVEGIEACDESVETATCDADCTLAECGDGQPNAAAAELCDDGNAIEDDGCNSQCGTANKCPQQAAIWYFGQNAGLDFTGGDPVAIDGPLVTGEGSAVLSDCAGEILASSTGTSVYDRNGDVMPNGNGDLLGGSSTTQSALMFFAPGSGDSEIYLFTVQELEGGSRPIHYSVIDMDLNGGLGDVDPDRKNISPSPEFGVLEHVAGVMHANESEVWVITSNSTMFHSYHVTAAGVSPPVESEVGGGQGYVGQLVTSPDGTRLALSQYWIGVELYDFDRATGVLTKTAVIDSITGPYGIEFSANGQVLYVSGYQTGTLSQYDISLSDGDAIEASEVVFPGTNRGLLRRGPDGKIYLGGWLSPAIGRINQPDVLGLGANFVANEIPLLPGTWSYYGLPSHVPGID